MKAPVYYRTFNYDKTLIPNKYLASLEDGVSTIEQATAKTGFTIGYPGWNLVYDMVLSHLHPEKYNIILETGTNVGCTTIMLAQALKDSGCRGKVYTVELDKESHEIALANLEKAGVSDFVQAINANSYDFLRDFVKINSSIRIAFLDASHLLDDVVAEFEAILPSLGPQSLVIFDNTYQIADENEDQRVNGALREIMKRHGGNLVNFETVSWYTPGLAVWQKSPFDCLGHQYDKGKIACGAQTKHKNRIVELCSQAHNLVTGGNYAEALELYERIIADVPGHISKTPQINYERALCLWALGRIREAEEALRFCLRVRPDDPELLRFLSEIQFTKRSIDAGRESKAKREPANVKQAEEANRLYAEVKTLLPLVQQIDIIRGLRAISSIEEQIVGRACGKVRNKLLNYLSIVQFARATGSKTVDSIEIGTLFGGSCLMKLFAMRDLGVQGKVVCIDPMSGFYDQTHDPQTGLAVTAEVFFENIRRFGFRQDNVDLRQVVSSNPRATEGLREGSFATLLIDGDHSYGGVRYDWENYYRFVQPGGIVLLDDYLEPKWPEITVFANELIDCPPGGWRKLGHSGTTLLLSRPTGRTKQVCQEPHEPKPAPTKLLAGAGALKKEQGTLAILDPELIFRRVDLISELAQYGINHLSKSPALGWNYVLDHVWITEEIERYLSKNQRRDLTVLDVGCGRSKFHNFLEKKFGINIIGIDRPQGYCHQAKLENADYYADFLELNVFGENSVDIIFWLSAIEHNEKKKIRQLFQKSMALLKDGGLFLATFAISKKTHWFEQSEQTNLSVEDSMDVFEEAKVDGRFDEIREKYRKNLLFLRDKYEKRYGRFQSSDPDFVVGAVKKIKAGVSLKSSSSGATTAEASCRYLLVPSNDTHVHWMYPLAQALEQAAFMVIPAKNERAEYYLTTLEEQFFVYQAGLLGRIRPGVIVFGCDWGGHERKVIQEAKDIGIPTVCIQEGCLDFMDQRANRMMHADYAFLQGPVMRRYFRETNNVVVTGNPKYDSLKETPLPQNVTVMINCNFTYRIFENVREQWVRDVAESCRELGLNFFISQHPRDRGVFPAGYPVVRSEASKVKEQLERTSILVSRFSTVIYEALMMGREAVYYNPHGELFRIFAGDHTGGIKIANRRSELVAALKSAVADLGRNKERREEFLRQHCGTLDQDAAERCARELRTIAQRHASSSAFATALKDKQDRPNAKQNNQTLPSVSVIIPFYNGGKYLGQAIESVLRQTFGDFEIIVVDDGSTDNTAEVVRSFGDPRINYVRHPENKGSAAARNTGLRQARGRYISFLDADDYFMPNKLADQVTFLEECPSLGLVVGAYLRVDEKGNVIGKGMGRLGEVPPEEVLVRNRFLINNTLIRRAWVMRAGGFDETLPAAEDWDFHCRLAIAGCRMYRLKNIVCAYRFVPGSLSMQAQQQTDAMLTVVNKTFSNRQLPGRFRGLENKALGRTHLMGAVRFYTAGDTEKGKYHLRQALKFDPQLCDDNYRRVIDLFLFWIDLMQIDLPVQYLEAVFDNLPAEAQDMRNLQTGVLQWAVEKYGAKRERVELSGSFETDRACAEKVLPDYNTKPAQYKDKHRARRYGTPCVSTVFLHRSKDNAHVSVIIPAYNAAKYVTDAIESVLIQNYRNFELLIIDDGSTDKTKDMVASFKDDKIKYFYKQNAGPSSARNFAIKRAKGQYIMPLDSDDMMTPDFISRHMMEFEEHPEADLVYCDDRLVGEDTKPIRVIERPEYTDQKLLIRDLFRCGFPVVPFRTCIRKRVFEKIGFFDKGLRIAEDYDMMRRFVKAGLKAHHLKAALYIRRMTADSLSRNFTLENAKFHFDVVKRFRDTFAYDELFPDVRWERIPAEHRQLHAKCLAAVTFLGIGQAYVKTNSVNYAKTAFDLACSELNECIKKDPGNMRVRQLLKRSEFARSGWSEPAPQAVC